LSKLVTGDGRTHIESPLMRESLVDRRVIAKTHSEREFEIMPDVILVGIGGQSIFDRGKAALLPVADELIEARGKHKMIVGVGGGTRVRHTISVALDLGLPTGGVAQLVGAMEEGLGGLTIGDLASDGAGKLVPAISDMGRQLTLARLILAWSEAEGGTRTPAQAAKLARELARLMDAMEIEDVDPARLGSLVPDALALHWERTLKFLAIVTAAWPAHLKEQGLVSQMQHAKHLVLAQARRLAAAPPPAPVIAAGVMSSVPVVTELLRVVTGLPNGALLLPGLDQSLDAESWESLVPAHPEHPQFGLKKLLDALGVRREDVAPLPGPEPTGPQRARAILLSEAMRPARTTERWHRVGAGLGGEAVAQALAGVAVLEAPGAEDEAEAVALILREAAETPGRTAALVTPDRALSRRVAARLATWQLRVEVAGQPLGQTAVGAFLDLAVEVAVEVHEVRRAVVARPEDPLIDRHLHRLALGLRGGLERDERAQVHRLCRPRRHDMALPRRVIGLVQILLADDPSGARVKQHDVCIRADRQCSFLRIEAHDPSGIR